MTSVSFENIFSIKSCPIKFVSHKDLVVCQGYVWKKFQKSHACTIKQLSLMNLFFFFMGEYIHFYRIKGSLRVPHKCTGKQMHRFVAGFHYLSVHMHSYLCKCTDLEVFHRSECKCVEASKYLIIYNVVHHKHLLKKCPWKCGFSSWKFFKLSKNS